MLFAISSTTGPQQVPNSNSSTPNAAARDCASVSGHDSSTQVSREDLRQSIIADGGLTFLRTYISRRMTGIFDTSTKLLPELATGTPGVFFDPELDVSPRATAERLVSFALGMMGIYRGQHTEMSEKELREGFEDVIRAGIKDGFEHARAVLSGIGILDGDIKANVDQTWDEVQQRLDKIFGAEVAEEAAEQAE